MANDEEEWDMYAPVLPMTPPDGWTLDNLPSDLPKHTELIRGALIVSPQKGWHLLAVRKLELALLAQAPPEYMILREMAVRKTPRSAPEPDVLVLRASAFDIEKSFLQPTDVFLAVEVVSPESEERDREDKPIMYATMGIPGYWLVERGEDDAPVVHEHRLVGDRFKLVRTHVGRLTTDLPFPIDIQLATIPG